MLHLRVETKTPCRDVAGRQDQQEGGRISSGSGGARRRPRCITHRGRLVRSAQRTAAHEKTLHDFVPLQCLTVRLATCDRLPRDEAGNVSSRIQEVVRDTFTLDGILLEFDLNLTRRPESASEKSGRTGFFDSADAQVFTRPEFPISTIFRFAAPGCAVHACCGDRIRRRGVQGFQGRYTFLRVTDSRTLHAVSRLSSAFRVP